jgi:hypothetical protein
MGRGNRRRRALGGLGDHERLVLDEYRRRREVRAGDGWSPMDDEFRSL